MIWNVWGPGGGVLVLILGGPRPVAPPSQRCARPKAWGAKEGLGATSRLATAHGGPPMGGVRPGIWRAP